MACSWAIRLSTGRLEGSLVRANWPRVGIIRSSYVCLEDFTREALQISWVCHSLVGWLIMTRAYPLRLKRAFSKTALLGLLFPLRLLRERRS